MPQGIVRVLCSCDGKGRPQIVSELTERELGAIGLVTVQWSYLEHQLYELALSIAGGLDIDPAPQEIHSSSFDRRCEALKSLLNNAGFPEQGRKRLSGLLHRTRRVEVDRHKITHGLWDWDYSNPYRPKASSQRKPHVFEEGFDLTKLVRLAERIGEINFELTFPAGVTYENIQMAYMSREATALMVGDAELSPPIDAKGLKRRRRKSKKIGLC